MAREIDVSYEASVGRLPQKLNIFLIILVCLAWWIGSYYYV